MVHLALSSASKATGRRERAHCRQAFRTRANHNNEPDHKCCIYTHRPRGASRSFLSIPVLSWVDNFSLYEARERPTAEKGNGGCCVRAYPGGMRELACKKLSYLRFLPPNPGFTVQAENYVYKLNATFRGIVATVRLANFAGPDSDEPSSFSFRCCW